MPIRKLPSGKYKWGDHGAEYDTRAGAERQAAAAHANGFKESNKSARPKGGDPKGWDRRSYKDFWNTIQENAKTGEFEKCVSKLKGHVRCPECVCAKAEKKATGHWPAEKKSGRSTTDVLRELIESLDRMPSSADHSPPPEDHSPAGLKEVDNPAPDHHIHRPPAPHRPDMPQRPHVYSDRLRDTARMAKAVVSDMWDDTASSAISLALDEMIELLEYL